MVPGSFKVKINELAQSIQAFWTIQERQALQFFTQWQQHYRTVTQLYYHIFGLARNLIFFFYIKLQVVQISTTLKHITTLLSML